MIVVFILNGPKLYAFEHNLDALSQSSHEKITPIPTETKKSRPKGTFSAKCSKWWELAPFSYEPGQTAWAKHVKTEAPRFLV